MRYTIFSIDDRRKHYVNAIHDQLGKSFHWNLFPHASVNGFSAEELEHNLNLNHLEINSNDIRVGQLGIWCTVINTLWDSEVENIVTFEDDAILHRGFNNLFWIVTSELPRDTDVFSLFLPRDQDKVFDSSMMVSQHICRAYQRYGGVSMLWTPRGMNKFISLVERDGILDQWDNQLYNYGRSGEMNVYTQPPGPEVLVSITGQEESIIQESERYK